jgi:flagellar hook-associated protein 1 FlgK
MGIYSINESASAALRIAQAGILVTSQNVAGTSIEGFSRRSASTVMDALAPNSLMLNGSSFAVEGFTREYSSLIGAQLLNQQAKSSYSETLVQYTSTIDSVIADKSAGLSSAITEFFNVLGNYAADPSNKALAAAITGSANVVSQRMTGITTLVGQLKSDTATGLNDTVRQINTYLPALADINQRILKSNSPGNTAPSADLLDERDRILTNLQKLVGGQSLINSDGTGTQFVAGLPLVERGISNRVSVNGDGKSIAVEFNRANPSGGQVMQTIQTVDGGQAGALLKMANEFIPKMEQRLNTTALALVKIANEAGQTSSSAPTSVAIFGFKVGSNTYSSLDSAEPTGLIPTLEYEADMVSLYNSLGQSSSALVGAKLIAENFVAIAPSDPLSYYSYNNATKVYTPLITSAKANSAEQKSSLLGNVVADLVTDVGVQIATWKNTKKADEVVLSNLKEQREQLSGVNLDEEAANLLRYQQLYSASTKILQTGNQMFNTLLAIMN